MNKQKYYAMLWVVKILIMLFEEIGIGARPIDF